MTIILAAKYREGIVVGYDTLTLREEKGRLVPAARIHKFRPIGNFPVGMGVSGGRNENWYAALNVELKESDSPLNGIRSFLRQFHAVVDQMNLPPEAHSEFVFLAEGKLFREDNECGLFEVERVGMGLGNYDAVERLMERGYSPSMLRDKAIQLVRDGVSLSERLNQDDSIIYEKGLAIEGIGITDVQGGRFNVLEFNERNPHVKRKTF